MEQARFWSILQYSLDHMPKCLARLFMMREVMEESTEIICDEFAITPANFWTTLYRARMGMRQCFERHWGEPGGR
jgi:RNA polymerase sigma-70 factor (ECF subfamily)